MTLINEEIKMTILPNSNYQHDSLKLSAFNEAFWGEKNNGFETLSQNLRNSQTAVKEFEIFLRECTTSEDQYVKQLSKITTQIQKFLIDTSLAPVWHQVLKDLNERNSWAHLHFMHRIQELIKEVQSYYDDLRKKKRRIRENENQTHQAVENFKNLKLQFTKQRDQYFQISSELEKQSQLLDYNQNHSPSSTPVQHLTLNIQKLEKKCLQSQNEYKQMIEKYNQAKNDYEHRFNESCNVFQAQEKIHLKQMRSFIMNYTQLVAQLNSTRQKNFNDCQQKLNNVYTNETLLEQFILTKGTGTEKPVEVEFLNPVMFNHSVSTMNSTSELNLTTTTRLMNQRLASQTDTSPTSSHLFEFPNNNERKNSDDSKNNKENLSEMMNSTKKISDSPESETKKRENKGFSIFNLDFRTRKSKKNYNTLNLKRLSLISKQEDEVDSKTLPSSTKSQRSDFCNPLPTSGSIQSILESPRSLHENVQINKQQKNELAKQISNDVFDKQLLQINELENKILKNKNSDDQIDENLENSNRLLEKDESFSSSVFNESSLNDMMTSLGSRILESRNIPIRKTANIQRNPIGSLITSTSLDNNRNFNNDYSSIDKKISLDFIEKDEENFFSMISDFDDINLDSINQMNPKIIEKEPTKDMNNYYVYSESSDDDDETVINKNLNKLNGISSKIQGVSSKSAISINKNDTSVTKKHDPIISHFNNDYENSDKNNFNIDNVEIDDVLSDESDSDSVDSDIPKKVVLKIKPISEVDRSLAASPDVLRQISKNLQLKFNKNNFQKSKKPYVSSYTRNTDSNLSKSVAEESSTSLSSSFVNLPNPNSASPSLQWFESRSASAVGFAINSSNSPLDFNNNVKENKVDLFEVNSSTIFDTNHAKAPPLPPLPVTIQQKYQKQLNLYHNHLIKNPNSHGQIKSEPILINTVKLSASIKNLENEIFDSKDNSLDGSMKSCLDSLESSSFKNLSITSDSRIKF